jgi:hypothetical protein
VVTSEPKQENRHTVVGRYELNCTNQVDGTAITDFALPVSWHFSLGDHMKGYVSPEIVRYVHGGDGVVIPRAVYDAKARTITVSAPGDGQLAVLASEPDRTWVNYAAVGGLVLVLIIIALFMPMRRHNKQNYREYLRAKYYNL